MWALISNISGNANTANGSAALNFNTDGDNNTANGYHALYYNTTGDYNSAVGYAAGPTSGALTNTTALGNGAVTTASNTIAIGNTAINSIKGQVGFSTFSDGRYKRNVREDVYGIDFIMGLRPVTYNLDIELLADKLQEDVTFDENGNRTQSAPSANVAASRSKQSSIRNTGFIAQEVEELANNLGYEFSGVDAPENEESMYSLRYAEFVVPLVKAMQEQQKKIEELEDRIKDLEINK